MTTNIEPELQSDNSLNQSATASQTVFWPVSVSKVLILSIATFGIYHWVWFYRNWRYLRQVEGQKVLPVLRSIFGLIFCHSLFKKVQSKVLEALPNQKPLSPTKLALSYIALTLAANAPGYLWLITFLAVIPLITVQKTINLLNQSQCETLKLNSKYTLLTIVSIILGLIIWILVAIGIFVQNTEDSEFKNIAAKIQTSTLGSSYRSTHGYQISLPDSNWHFLPKEQAKNIFSSDFPEAEILFSNSNVSFAGFFITEYLSDYGDYGSLTELTKEVQRIYKEQLADFTFEKVEPVKNGFNLHFSKRSFAENYYYIKSFRTYKRLAITSFIWSELNKKNEISAANQSILNSIKEIKIKPSNKSDGISSNI
jgi:hypothetical protein